MFLANYGDTLTDVHLPDVIDAVRASDAVGSFLCVKPNWAFHVVDFDEDGRLLGLRDAIGSNIRINGGYFCFRSEILDHLRPGEDLVEQPFERLIEAGRLLAYRYEGFWAPMDSLKDKQVLDGLHDAGRAPWSVWREPRGDLVAAELLRQA